MVFLDGLEPYLLKTLEEGPFTPMSPLSTPENPQPKSQNQWTHAEARLVNQDKCLKSIIYSCLPTDVMQSILKCKIAKDIWNDLILAYEGPSDTRDTKIAALRLKFNAFKSLEGEAVKGTFTRLKCLLNDLESNDVTIPQAEVNATFVNALLRKCLIDEIYDSETQRFAIGTSSSKALIFNSHSLDSDSDVEEDNRSNNEFMDDLNAEYQERALLANQKRFYKRFGRVGAAGKPIDKSKEICFACEKACYFQKDCPSYKTSTPSYPSLSKPYHKPKSYTPAFTHTPSPNPSKLVKDYEGKYNGLKAKITLLMLSKDKGEKVKGTTRIKAFMAIAKDEPSVRKADAIYGQWVEITMKKVHRLTSMPDDDDRKHVLYYTYVDLHYVEDQRKNLVNKFNSLKNEVSVYKSKLALGGKRRKTGRTPCSEVVFYKADESSSRPNPENLSDSESKGEPQKPLLALPKLLGADPTGTSTSLVSLTDLTINLTDLSLMSNSVKKISKKQDKISNHQVIKKKVVPKPTTEPKTCPNKKANSSTEQLLHTLMEEVKCLKDQIKTPLGTPPSDSQASSSSSNLTRNKFEPYTHYGLRSHHHSKCFSKPKSSRTTSRKAPLIPRPFPDYALCGFNNHHSEDKFDEKADDGFFLGYSPVAKAFRVFNIKRQEIEETYHVTFSKDDGAISQTNTEETPETSANLIPDYTNDDNDSEVVKYLGDSEEQDQIISESNEPQSTKPHPNQLPSNEALTNPLSRDSEAASAEECLYVNFLSTIEPNKIIEALAEEGWLIAMQKELNQFKRNKVWTLVPRPYDKSVIKTKWIWKNKMDHMGIVSKNKARLVAQGFNQQEEIDYDETFTPVARLEAIRIFLAYAVYMGFRVYKMDVKNTFLNRNIVVEVYVGQPPRFERSEYPDYVFKLDKAPYSLKQAPKACFGSTSDKISKQFAKLMTKKYEISMMEELTYFLGFQVKQDSKEILIYQEKYVKDLLKKYDLADCASVKRLMLPPNNMGPDESGVSVNETLFIGMIGSLMYLTASRPDIQFSTCLCARYPKGSDLKAYSDSDYAGCNLDRKSTSGGCQILGGKLMCWSSKKQNSVAMSLAEADNLHLHLSKKPQMATLQQAKNIHLPLEAGIINYNNVVAFLESTNEDFSQMLQFIKNCCISEALTKEPSAYYEKLLRKFWYTVEGDATTKSITFNLSRSLQSLTVDLDTFAAAIGLKRSETFVSLPKKETVKADKSQCESSMQPKAPTASKPRKKKNPPSSRPKDFVDPANAPKSLEASESAEDHDVWRTDTKLDDVDSTFDLSFMPDDEIRSISADNYRPFGDDNDNDMANYEYISNEGKEDIFDQEYLIRSTSWDVQGMQSQLTDILQLLNSAVILPEPTKGEKDKNAESPKLKSFNTLGETLSEEELKAQLLEMKRLADLKAEKDKSEDKLKKIFNPATLDSQAQKWKEHEAKKAKSIKELNHLISLRADPLQITKISYIVNKNKEPTIRIIRDNDPLNIVVLQNFRLRSSILSREVLPDVRSAYATISSEESHRVASSSVSGSSQRSQASAFVSNVPNKNNVQRNNWSFNVGPRPNNVNNDRQDGGSGLVCENCGFNGHTIDRCFKIIGYPSDFGKKKFGNQNQKNKGVSNNNSVGSSSSTGFSDEQMATLYLLTKTIKLEIMKIVDSGANQHMTYTEKDLENVLDISYLKIKVGHPNRTEAFISKIGNLKFSNGLTLYDVMVIPEYCATLIYVHKMAKDNKFFIVFDENRCYFVNQDLNLNNVLGIGDQCEGLYYYNEQGVNHINFFDTEYFKIPNDDERVDPKLNSDNNKSESASSSSSESGGVYVTADFPVNTGNDADSNAMNLEMDALLRNGTWELVDLLEGRKAIGSKWIYKIKFQSSGAIDRFKARLVAQGFGQKEGIDYEETFSPVVKMVSVRCLLNIVMSRSCPIFQLDVNNAFLYGGLDEIFYMKPPGGFFTSSNKVWRLKKSLYGLKQVPRQWNAKLTFTLTENGFSQSKSDYSLFTKSDKGVFLALLVYVDDIIITGNNVVEIENFKVFLKSKFMIKDLGKLKYFLGIEVVDTEKGICLNQRKYVLDLLSEYGMLACKPVDTPLLSKLVISNEATKNDPVLENITDYQKLMGKLIYLTNTRPDISYVVHGLS
nr:ribonuclease H-like domain-containing protein [Tanacetum cinerariifolium]